VKTAGSLLLRLAIVALLAFLSISITSFAHEAAAADRIFTFPYKAAAGRPQRGDPLRR
jgi:hypothetical protein